jgi:hypothetical protein
VALAAALLCTAAAPLPETHVTNGDSRSAVERHWLVYVEIRHQKDHPPQ